MKFDLDLTDDGAESASATVPASDLGQAGASPPPTEIVNPLTGEIISLADVDGMIETFKQIKKHEQALAIAKREIALALVAKTDAAGITTKTRRVLGSRGQEAKIEMPDSSWDQGILREAWHSYPQHREKLLRIGELKVNAVEFKKAVNTASPDDFTTFVQMIVKAQRKPTGIARVTVEQSKE